MKGESKGNEREIRGVKNKKHVNLKDSLGKNSIIFFDDLSLIRRPIEGWRIIVDILDMNNHCRVVFIQVV